MKKILSMLAFAALFCFAGCNDDIDALEKEIDSLKSRLTALETQVDALNGNVDALAELSKKGATLLSVEQASDGTYTITLSNGEVLTLAQGSEAEAVIPVIGIDAEGYWVVDYKDGAGFVRILVNGEPVKSTADDGITPMFRIDNDGYWEISYDDGKSYEAVLDVNGQKVSALGTGEFTDKFFSNVTTDGEFLYIKLLTGEEIVVPIVPDFYCRIIAPEGVQLFTSKQTQRYSVEIKGVDNTIITAPNGWTATLTDVVDDKATLIVTAPETGTRSMADNLKDVSILAVAGYYATIAKIQVEVEGSIVVTPPTVKGVECVAEKSTETSLTFAVEVSEDADAWMYLLQGAGEPAPEASTIASTGKVGVGQEVTVAGLTADTEYKLYVIAIKNPTVYSEVYSLAAKTNAPKPDYIDYYEEGVTIDGVAFSKSDGVLVTESTAITADGVYFIDPADGAEITLTANGDVGLGKLVIIGRYSNKMPTVKITGIVTMNAKSFTDGFIFKNVYLDASSHTNYIFNFAGTAGEFERFVVEDAVIKSGAKKPLSYFNAASGVKRVIFKGSKVALNMSAHDEQGNIMNFAAKCSIGCLSYVYFGNNVFYSPEGVVSNSMLLNLTTNALPNLDVVIEGNTIVNMAGKSNGYVNSGGLKSIVMKKNVLWIDTTYTGSCYLCKISKESTTTLDLTDNVIYGLTEKGKWSSHTGTLPTGLDAKPALTVQTETPFSSMDFEKGIFILNSEHAGYGSTLQ